MAWYEEAFNADYDRIHMHSFTEERNTAEADFIESVLSISPGSEMLDLACGHGRHALILSARGYKVTGLDLSERFVKLAQAEAKRRKLEAVFEVGDMRKIPYKSKFDGVYCYFTSFGYFPHRENVKTLEAVARSLGKGGRFMLETANRDWLLRQIEAQPRRWEEISPDFLYLEDTGFNARTSRITTRRIVVEGTDRRELNFDLRLYALAELEDLIELAGMKIVSTYGGRDRSPFSISSHRMVILSEKT